MFFGFGGFPESSEPLIEKQIIQEPQTPKQIPMNTFIQNGSPVLGNVDAPITFDNFDLLKDKHNVVLESKLN